MMFSIPDCASANAIGSANGSKNKKYSKIDVTLSWEAIPRYIYKFTYQR